MCQGREHICKKASSANHAAMWKGTVRNLVPGDAVEEMHRPSRIEQQLQG